MRRVVPLFFTILTVLATLAHASEDVVVKLADGAVVKGELASLSVDSLSVATGGNIDKWSLDQVREIRLRDDSSPVTPFARVFLQDGSQMNCKTYVVQDGMAEIEFDNSKAKIATAQIRYVRFAPFRPKVAKQWDDVLEAARVSDTLVVRRPNDAIDYIDGIIGDIDSEHVKFEFDDDWIDVKFAKIDGLVYFQSDKPVLQKPACSITTVQGSQLAAESVSVDDLDDGVVVSTLDGQSIRLAYSDVLAITFANRSTSFLSDLEPERIVWRPVVASSIVDDLSQFFRPRFDSNFRGEPLSIRVDGQTRDFTKGISALSHSEITYRLAGEYRSFQAIVGIDAEIAPSGDARLEIWSDTVKVVDDVIKGTESAIPIKVDLSGVGRMRIVVTNGSFLGDGDYVNLCDARLLK